MFSLPAKRTDVFQESADHPDTEAADDDEKGPDANGFQEAAHAFGDVDHPHATQLGRQGEEPVDETGHDRHGVKAPNRDARHHLGDHGADLDAKQGTQQHAHGQGIEDEPIDGILGDGSITRGENDLKDVGAHRGHGGDAQHVDEDGEGEKSAAHAHDTGRQPHQCAGKDQEYPGDASAARGEVKIEFYHGGDIHPLQLTRQTAQVGAFRLATVGPAALILATGHGFLGLEKIIHGVKSEETQHQCIDRGDEGVGKHRVQLV
ncbi:hypothetical protein DESC_260108 [Desulfosarcina cetonica]|nr:hypothetical protein DESC_260108 [Desulfosarcina cetonica]